MEQGSANFCKEPNNRTSLEVHRLRLRASTAGGEGSIPGRRRSYMPGKIPYAVLCGQKKKEPNNKYFKFCRPKYLCHKDCILLMHKSSHRQYVKWAWLHSNKTLFLKTASDWIWPTGYCLLTFGLKESANEKYRF